MLRPPVSSTGRTALLVSGLVVACALGRADSPRADTPAASSSSALPVEHGTLPNGLEVVLAPDRSVSTVRVLVRYRGGAANEPKGREGFTHLVERLFAQGTVHTKAGELEQRIDAAGGWTTSATTLDDLTLSTEVPPGALELALFLDAERMAGLADGITEAGLSEARDSIAAEYRAAYIDQPYGLVARATRDALWPEGHENRRDVLGDAPALAHASLADVRTYVRERIQPQRATLVIVGNFSPGKAKGFVRRYFGWIPASGDHIGSAATGGTRSALGSTSTNESASTAGATSTTSSASTLGPLRSPVELEVSDPVAQVVVAYRVPADRASELDVALLARALAGSPTARLERALVDAGRASEVRAEVSLHARGGALEIHATPAAGADPKRLAADIRAELAALASTALSDETFAAIQTAHERERLLALETLAGRASTFDRWSEHASLDAYVAEGRKRLGVVTPRSIQALARTWLAERSAVTVIAGPRVQ